MHRGAADEVESPINRYVPKNDARRCIPSYFFQQSLKLNFLRRVLHGSHDVFDECTVMLGIVARIHDDVFERHIRRTANRATSSEQQE